MATDPLGHSDTFIDLYIDFAFDLIFSQEHLALLLVGVNLFSFAQSLEEGLCFTEEGESLDATQVANLNGLLPGFGDFGIEILSFFSAESPRLTRLATKIS